MNSPPARSRVFSPTFVSSINSTPEASVGWYIISVGRIANTRSLVRAGSTSIAKSTFASAFTACSALMKTPPLDALALVGKFLVVMVCHSPDFPVSKRSVLSDLRMRMVASGISRLIRPMVKMEPFLVFLATFSRSPPSNPMP